MENKSSSYKEASPRHIESTFVGSMEFTEEQQEVRTTTDIASIQSTPINLTKEQLYKQTKDHNKVMKKNPPKLSTVSKRPEVTDAEIAFIHAAFYTTPTEIIAHTLGLTTSRVEELRTQTNHHLLPTIPLLIVTDTSRYLNDEELRTIKDFDDLNHFEDLRTSKELLRLPEEKSTNSKILKNYLESSFKEANPQIELRLYKGSCKLPEDSTEESIGLYGHTECDIARGLKRTYTADSTEATYSLDYINYHTSSYKTKIFKDVKFVYLNHPSYYQKFNYKTSKDAIDTANVVIKYFQDKEEDELLQLPFTLSSHLNVALNRYITKAPCYQTISTPNDNLYHNVTVKYANYVNNKEAYLSEFKKETNEYITTVHHQFTLPYTNERALGSPLLDSNRNLRYTPINLTYLSSNKVEKESSLKYAIVCHECSSLLSKDTVDHCPHIRLSIGQYKANLIKRTPNNRPLRLTTKYDYTFKESHKDIYTLYLDTTNPPIYSIHYYETLPFKPNNMPFYEYITKVSPNILPLFSNFSLPIASTLQEPSFA